MRIGISAYDLRVTDLVELAVSADASGFDSLWLGEHVLLPVGYGSTHPTHEGVVGVARRPIIDPRTELVDPLVALAAAAAVTSRLLLATGIYLLPLRHPIMTARATATLAEVSGGRFLLGIGSGWLEEEFAALGVAFGDRRGLFEESIDVLRAAWAGGPFEHHGAHHDFGPVQTGSRPVHVPLVLGGNTDVALARAARLGDGWFSSGTPTFDDARSLRDRLLAMRADLGLDGPFRCWVRVEGAEAGALARYEEAGFTDVVVWAHHLWPAEGTPSAKRDAFRTAAERLGLGRRDAAPAPSGTIG